MKYALAVFAISIFASCSGPLDGLWIETHEWSLLKFHRDSVIHSNLTINGLCDTLGFRLTKDSITFSGFNPEIDNGPSPRSCKYDLKGDTLNIWYALDQKYTYVRSPAENFHEHLITKGQVKLDLPSAEQVKMAEGDYDRLNVRIGFRNKEVKVFVNDMETPIREFDKAVKEFKSDTLNRIWATDICQLLIDENVTCEYTFWIMDHLRANDIRRISFISQSKNCNPYTPEFCGLMITIPASYFNIIEVKDED